MKLCPPTKALGHYSEAKRYQISLYPTTLPWCQEAAKCWKAQWIQVSLNLHCLGRDLSPLHLPLRESHWSSAKEALSVLLSCLARARSRPPAQITHVSNPHQHPSPRLPREGKTCEGTQLQPQSSTPAVNFPDVGSAQVLVGLISASSWPRCLAAVCWCTALVKSLWPNPGTREGSQLKEEPFPPRASPSGCSLAPLGSVLSMPSMPLGYSASQGLDPRWRAPGTDFRR